MPELPDVEIFSGNLKKLFAGQQLTRVKIVNGKKLKDSPQQIKTALTGKKLRDVYRTGKEIRFLFEDNLILGLHLMLTGDIYVLEKNDYKSTIVELHFSNKKMLVLTDRMKNAYIKLEPVDKKGIDALKINYSSLKKILSRNRNIKSILIDQDLIRGIGNGYSDEILWASQISPFSTASAIPDEKIKVLASNIKKILKKAIKDIRKSYPDIIHGEIKDFLKVHTKKKNTSPTGYPILIKDKGMSKTYYTEEQELFRRFQKNS